MICCMGARVERVDESFSWLYFAATVHIAIHNLQLQIASSNAEF